MPDIGVPELLIIAVIVVLLFGPGKAADIGGALGKSIREFRKASREDESATPVQSSVGSPPSTPRPEAGTGSPVCPSCGASAGEAHKFCVNCGAQLSPAPSEVH